MAKLTEQEAAKLKESLRGHLNAVLIKYPKAGPGILRKLWGELLVEKFGPPPTAASKQEPWVTSMRPTTYTESILAATL